MMTMITTTKTTKTKMMTMMMMTFIFPSFLSLSLLPLSFLHSIYQLAAFACHSYYHLCMPHLRMAPFRSKLHRLVLLSLVGPVWHKQCQCCITNDTTGQCTGFDLGWELLQCSLLQFLHIPVCLWPNTYSLIGNMWWSVPSLTPSCCNPTPQKYPWLLCFYSSCQPFVTLTLHNSQI
jgi:hypothetical protein